MITLTDAFFHMATALTCGAIIGSERQMRRRMAGLRTNALVALGAAAFVTFSQQITGDASPSRVAAQVVSGIGFLGAGIIFRDGFEVHGLNTAATLWCSAGVGLLSASGDWHIALLMTAMVVFVNLGLRPLVKLLKRRTGTVPTRSWRILLACPAEAEGVVRGALMQALVEWEVTGLEARRGDPVELAVTAEGGMSPGAALQRLAHLPQVLRLEWSPLEEG